MNVEELLSRFDKFTGKHPQWQVRCPAHDDNGPSLSIADATNGRILMHCFAGCGIGEICAALGIGIDELFPDKPLHQSSLYLGQQGNQRWIDATAVLKALQQELTIQAIASADVARGRVLTENENARRRISAERITDALRYARSLR